MGALVLARSRLHSRPPVLNDHIEIERPTFEVEEVGNHNSGDTAVTRLINQVDSIGAPLGLCELRVCGTFRGGAVGAMFGPSYGPEIMKFILRDSPKKTGNRRRSGMNIFVMLILFLKYMFFTIHYHNHPNCFKLNPGDLRRALDEPWMDPLPSQDRG